MPVPVVAIARQDTRRSAAFAGRRHRRAFFIVSIQDLSGFGGDLQRFCSKEEGGPIAALSGPP